MKIEPGRIINIEQNTPMWKAWRDSGIGGSDAAIIKLGNVYGKTVHDLWLQKRGYNEAKFKEAQQAHIDRGHEIEPLARKRFAELTGFVINPVCMQSSVHPFMLASLDGMTPDGVVGVEIKAHNKNQFDKIEKAIASGQYQNSGNIPPEYYTQIQHQLAVTGAREFYYWAYNNEDGERFIMQRVTPDYAYIEQLIRLETQFQWYVVNNVMPVDTEHPAQGEFKTRIKNAGLIMLAGAATAGKDEMGLIYQRMLKVERFSFSDPLREIYAFVQGITEEALEKEKEKHRPGLVNLGHGLRKYVPNVWIDAVFNETTGIFDAMQGNGAIITSTRYLNEVSHGKRWADKLGVPFRLIYIERPGVIFANETEAGTLTLVRKVADVIFYNDLNITTLRSAEQATEAALISAMTPKNIPYGQDVVHASNYLRDTAKMTAASKRKVKKALPKPAKKGRKR